MIPLSQWMKWFRMVAGTSVLHLPQGPGRFYVKDDLQGYYNDLRHKVYSTANIDQFSRPINTLSSGREVYLVTAVAQYGLGAYDLYLEKNSDEYLKKALACSDWLVENLDDDGAWDVWSALGMESSIKSSAMTQGEGASLLFRAARQTGNGTYYDCAERALDLMLKTEAEGGPARIEGERIHLEELVENPVSTILNGWIFAIFGLHDGVLATGRQDFRLALERSLETLAADLSNYDNGYWSLYDRLGRLASPFYHDLHLALLEACAHLFEAEQFNATFRRWQEYKEMPGNRRKAFVVKAWQKMRKYEGVVITE